MVSFKDYLRNVDDSKSKHLLETIWKKSLFHLNKSDFSSCFDCYTFLLENCPQIGSFIERHLQVFLSRWINYVVSHKREDQLQAVIAAHALAVRHCQDAGIFFNSCGKLFFRLQKLLDAKVYFEEARRLSPKNMEVLENLDNLNCLLIDRWHFPMLNDAVRNSSYKRSIERAFSRISSVSQEPFVCLDIGAGTGLLSMYMARAVDDIFPSDKGKIKVVSCEVDECMFRTAEEVLRANGMSERIELVHSSSSSLLSLPGCRDNVKLKLVVTETFDAGLLGEGVLESLDHVHRVLGEPGTDLQVIPRAATVYICLLESEDIRNYSRYLGRNDWLTSDDARIFCNVAGKADDGSPRQPYTCERISSLGRSFAPLSEPVAVETINFESPECVSSCLAGITRQLSIQVNRSGSLDAIALWFDLHLDSETDLSTSPLTFEGQRSCWQQAVYPVYDIEGRRDAFVKEGDLASIECEIKDLIRLRCSGIRGPSNSDHGELVLSSSAVPSFYLPPSSVALLNDSVYHGKCCEALEKVFSAGDRNALGLVVASRPDSVSGLAVALRSLGDGVRVRFLIFDENRNVDFDDGVSGAVNVSKMLKEIATHKGLDLNLVSFERFPDDSASEWIDDFEESSDDDDDDDDEEEEEEEEDDEGHNEVNWAVGFLDPIESSGSLSSSSVKHLFRLKKHLSAEHKILPSKIHCMGVLVDSQSLVSDSAVLSGESTSPFEVADAMNKFKTSYHVNFQLSTLPHTRLTCPLHLFTLDMNASTTTWRSFSDKSCTLTVRPVAGGRATSLVYWFRLELIEGLVVDTSEGHWKQAAVHLDALQVEIGDLLKLEVHCWSGYFRAQVEKVR